LNILDVNREMVLANGGCELLTELVSKCCDPTTEDFNHERYKCVVCGCILNLSADNGMYNVYMLCDFFQQCILVQLTHLRNHS